MAYSIKSTIVNREVKLNPNTLGSLMTLGFGIGLYDKNLKKENIMYKKITHTITEEHFAHPMATEIKKLVDKNTKATPKPKLGTTPSATNLQNSISLYFTNYASKMRDVITSVFNNTLPATETTIFSEIDSLGSILQPYYGFDVAQRINEVTRQLVLSVISSSKNIRDGADNTNEKNNLNMAANQLAKILNLINNSWNYAIIRDTIISTYHSWLDEATAINKNDKVADNAAFNTVNQNLTAVANMLINGIEQQFPEQFTS